MKKNELIKKLQAIDGDPEIVINADHSQVSMKPEWVEKVFFTKGEFSEYLMENVIDSSEIDEYDEDELVSAIQITA